MHCLAKRLGIVDTNLTRPYGQAVKTSPFHGGNPGSNPGRVTISHIGPVVQLVRMPACHAGGRRFESVPGRHMEEYPSWPKGADCKSVSFAFTGSNPVSSTIYAEVAQW